MDKDRVEGKVREIAGRAQRQAGEVTGDSETQAKGAAKQAEGKIQNALGKVKDRSKMRASEPARTWKLRPRTKNQPIRAAAQANPQSD